MSKNYCQGPKCHTYDTSDRKRGPKDNRINQTRTVGQYGFGDRNFCTLNCQNDWWSEYGTQAVDYFGRLFKPKVLTAENGWRQVWNPAYWSDNTVPRFIERNMMTKEERPIQEG